MLNYKNTYNSTSSTFSTPDIPSGLSGILLSGDSHLLTDNLFYQGVEYSSHDLFSSVHIGVYGNDDKRGRCGFKPPTFFCVCLGNPAILTFNTAYPIYALNSMNSFILTYNPCSPCIQPPDDSPGCVGLSSHCSVPTLYEDSDCQTDGEISSRKVSITGLSVLHSVHKDVQYGRHKQVGLALKPSSNAEIPL